MSETAGIGGLVKQTIGQLDNKYDEINDKITDITTQEGGIKPEDLMMLQFEMSQYTATTEVVSNVAKSVADTLKSLAQKAGG